MAAAHTRPASAGATGNARIDSLRRIQAYLLSPKGSAEQAKLPEPKTLFSALQTVLENHSVGHAEEQTIARAAIETLGDACAWLPQWCEQEDRRAGKVQGPGHAQHVARGCVVLVVPAIINCFARQRLFAAAEVCLARIASCEEDGLPDVCAILCSSLVHHGMENDDKAIRLASTRCLPRLLAQGLASDPHLYHSVLEGLVGRVRDIEEDNSDAAVEALSALHSSDPDSFLAAVPTLGPMHQQLVHHYRDRIGCSDLEAAAGGVTAAGAAAATACSGRGLEDDAVLSDGPAAGGYSRQAGATAGDTPAGDACSDNDDDAKSDDSDAAESKGAADECSSSDERSHALPRRTAAAAASSDSESDAASSSSNNSSSSSSSSSESSEADAHSSSDDASTASNDDDSDGVADSKDVESSSSDQEQQQQRQHFETLKSGSPKAVKSSRSTSSPKRMSNGAASAKPVLRGSSGSGGMAAAAAAASSTVQRGSKDFSVQRAHSGATEPSVALGFIPRDLYAALSKAAATSSDATENSASGVAAAERLLALVSTLNKAQRAAAAPHTSALLTLLCELISGAHIKVTLTALLTVSRLAAYALPAMAAHAAPVLQLLVAHLSDSRVAVRHHAAAALAACTAAVGLAVSLPHLLEALSAQQQHAPEAALRVVCGALLLDSGAGGKREQLAAVRWLPSTAAVQLVEAVADLLRDSSPHVAAAALETLAVLQVYCSRAGNSCSKQQQYCDVVGALLACGAFDHADAVSYEELVCNRLRQPQSSLPHLTAEYLVDFAAPPAAVKGPAATAGSDTAPLSQRGGSMNGTLRGATAETALPQQLPNRSVGSAGSSGSSDEYSSSIRRITAAATAAAVRRSSSSAAAEAAAAAVVQLSATAGSLSSGGPRGSAVSPLSATVGSSGSGSGSGTKSAARRSKGKLLAGGTWPGPASTDGHHSSSSSSAAAQQPARRSSKPALRLPPEQKPAVGRRSSGGGDGYSEYLDSGASPCCSSGTSEAARAYVPSWSASTPRSGSDTDTATAAVAAGVVAARRSSGRASRNASPLQQQLAVGGSSSSYGTSGSGSDAAVAPAAASVAGSTDASRSRGRELQREEIAYSSSSSSTAANHSSGTPDQSKLSALKQSRKELTSAKRSSSSSSSNNFHQSTGSAAATFITACEDETTENELYNGSSSSTLHRGRRASSAAAAARSSSGSASYSNGGADSAASASAAASYTAATLDPRALAASGRFEPVSTPVPIGRYDERGARHHMQTSVQQTMPLQHASSYAAAAAAVSGNGAASAGSSSCAHPDERPIRPARGSSSSGDAGDAGTGAVAAAYGSNFAHSEHWSDAPQRGDSPAAGRAGVSAATARRRERLLQQQQQQDSAMLCTTPDSSSSSNCYYYGAAAGSAATTATTTAASSAYGEAGAADFEGAWTGGIAQQQGHPPGRRGGYKAGGSGLASPSKNVAIEPPVHANGPGASLHPDAFDYLTAEDLRPSPNPRAELARTLVSLSKDDWPEIFHTLNSVRRLALHHSALVEGSVHEIIRDVLKQCENLRSQVAKNALLTIGDLWRGLKKSLDPELPLVAPLLIKKYADKVEFLKEAAEQSIEDVVQCATDLRALTAFLGCGQARAAILRAKAAATVLKCVKRVGPRLGGTREADKLLSALPLFLQDGNQETRQHGKAITTYLLSTGAIEETRLRRAIPEHVMARLEREAAITVGQGPVYTASPARAARAHFASTAAATAAATAASAGAAGAVLGSTGGVSLVRRRSSASAGSAYESGSSSSTSATASAAEAAVAGLALELGGTHTGGSPANLSAYYGGSDGSTRAGRGSSSRGRSGRGGSSIAAGRHATQRSSSGGSSSSAAAELEELPAALALMDNSDWKTRQSGLERAVALLLAKPAEFCAAGRAAKVVDCVCDRMQDGNLKVSLSAYECLPGLCSGLGDALEPSLAALLPPLLSGTASNNKPLAAAAAAGRSALLQCVDPRLLAPPLAALAEHGAPRLRPAALTSLKEVVGPLWSAKPAAVTRLLLPCAAAAAADAEKGGARAEGQAACRALVLELRGVMGKSAFEDALSGYSEAQLRAVRAIAGAV